MCFEQWLVEEQYRNEQKIENERFDNEQRIKEFRRNSFHDNSTIRELMVLEGYNLSQYSLPSTLTFDSPLTAIYDTLLNNECEEYNDLMINLSIACPDHVLHRTGHAMYEIEEFRRNNLHDNSTIRELMVLEGYDLSQYSLPSTLTFDSPLTAIPNALLNCEEEYVDLIIKLSVACPDHITK
jgi:hypothetical protein